MKPLPSKQVLWNLLDYDPDSGELTWKPRNEPAWDARYAGKSAFTSTAQGYKVGTIYGIHYAAHRVIWVMITGKEPVGVDHEDHNRSNNKWKNLREVTPLINSQNQKTPKTNTSGYIGVSWSKKKQKWIATINHQQKQILLGAFDDIHEAVKARKTAEQFYGYHVNHGK